jgi:hypothetical protein
LSKEEVIKNKTILYLVAIILLITGGGYYFLPHLALYNIKEAAENNDSETLSDYVDYHSLRESLKINLNIKVAGSARKGKDGDPMKNLGSVFSDAFMNPMIDSLITPENVALFMKGIKPGSSRMSGKSSETKTKLPAQKAKIKISMSYKGFNRFVVKIKREGFSENPIERRSAATKRSCRSGELTEKTCSKNKLLQSNSIELILKRDGLLSWKLSALHIP